MRACHSMTTRCLALTALGVGLVWAGSAWPAAGDPLADLDLTLRSPDDPDTWVKPTLRADNAWFFESNAWAGNDRELIGGDSSHWMEWGVIPGVEGQLSLGDAGTLRARVSAIYTQTQVGLDAAGSNLDDRHPSAWTLEDAYVGWSSGDLFPSLGKDAIDLSVGSQQYTAGTGFLFMHGGTDGGSRGAYWLSLRNAFRFTGIARLKTGPLSAEAVWLRPYDEPNTSTEIVGANFDYSFGERAKAGFGYWNVYESDDERRDGLHVINLRLDATPLMSVPQLGFSGEVVRERNGKRNNSWGGYTQVAYDFGEKLPWKPVLSYRFASFSGDDGSGDNRAFDPLFYGFPDWGTWYIGEIVGEYVATNRNQDIHTVRLRLTPSDPVSVQVLYHFFRLRERQNEISSRPPTSSRIGLIEDKRLGHEVNVAVDWSLTSYLSMSFVGAALFPSSGGRDFFADDDTWLNFMAYASLNF
jgi:hypothetical protein